MNREEAIKIVRSHYPANKQMLNEALEYLIPELKKVTDELTWLKNYISEEAYTLSMDIRDNEDSIKLQKLQKALAWLEKQGEQKQGKSALEAINEEKVDNANKIESDFDIGDGVVCKDGYTFLDDSKCARITKFDKWGENSRRIWFNTTTWLKARDIRLWTIEDAKDGDVLVASDGSIFMFSRVIDNECGYHVALANNGRLGINLSTQLCWESKRGAKPATKEQKELLFKKIEESGYKWDAENKQLIKI